MSTPPDSPNGDALVAVRDLERTLDARAEARAEADRILDAARQEAAGIVADAGERGELAAQRRRGEGAADIERAVLELSAAADADAGALAETAAAQAHAVDDALLAIVIGPVDEPR